MTLDWSVMGPLEDVVISALSIPASPDGNFLLFLLHLQSQNQMLHLFFFFFSP